MTFVQQDDSNSQQQRLYWEDCQLCYLFALLRHQRVLHVPLYVCVSISYSSHKLCGAIAQRIRFGILDFFFFVISFMPQALSGMGWLHTENVHAQHACDHNRFTSIPAIEKNRTETFTFSLQVC